jgi:segregation and condensation protein B
MSEPQADQTTEPRPAADAAPAEAIDEQEHAPCLDVPLPAGIEALLMSTDRPLAEDRLAGLLGIGGKGGAASVHAAIEQLNEEYERTGRAFRAQRVAGGWQLLTLPSFGPLVSRLHRERREARLSQPALETLAIVAYRQPIMRAEIEAIRGVACGEVLRALLERRLIRITGRAEQLGRPMLYGTTGHFLKVFGLPGLDALPPLEGGPAVPEPPSQAPPTETPDSEPAGEGETETVEPPGADPTETPDAEPAGTAAAEAMAVADPAAGEAADADAPVPTIETTDPESSPKANVTMEPQ